MRRRRPELFPVVLLSRFPPYAHRAIRPAGRLSHELLSARFCWAASLGRDAPGLSTALRTTRLSLADSGPSPGGTPANEHTAQSIAHGLRAPRLPAPNRLRRRGHASGLRQV